MDFGAITQSGNEAAFPDCDRARRFSVWQCCACDRNPGYGYATFAQAAAPSASRSRRAQIMKLSRAVVLQAQ
jgi:hypothetical protein